MRKMKMIQLPNSNPPPQDYVQQPPVDPEQARPFIYLASPHSDDEPKVRQWRHDRVCEYAANLIRMGNIVFCPIAHSHSMAERMVTPSNNPSYVDWQHIDEFYLKRADILMIYALPGWEESYGIKMEIDFAARNGKSIIVIPYIEEKASGLHSNTNEDDTGL